MSNVQRNDLVDPSEQPVRKPGSDMPESSVPSITEYPEGSGKPLIVLNPGARFPFSFGLAKAVDGFNQIGPAAGAGQLAAQVTDVGLDRGLAHLPGAG